MMAVVLGSAIEDILYTLTFIKSLSLEFWCAVVVQIVQCGLNINSLPLLCSVQSVHPECVRSNAYNLKTCFQILEQSECLISIKSNILRDGWVFSPRIGASYFHPLMLS